MLALTVPAGSVMSGVEYDYLRLEVDAKAAPPTAEGGANGAGNVAAAPGVH